MYYSQDNIWVDNGEHEIVLKKPAQLRGSDILNLLIGQQGTAPPWIFATDTYLGLTWGVNEGNNSLWENADEYISGAVKITGIAAQTTNAGTHSFHAIMRTKNITMKSWLRLA